MKEYSKILSSYSVPELRYRPLLLAGAPIDMFINIYAGDSPIRKTCNFDKPLNYILQVLDDCMYIFCLVSIETHKIRMLELQPSPFFTDSLH